MVMDPRLRGLYDSINGLKFNALSIPDQNFTDVLKLEDEHLVHYFRSLPRGPPDRNPDMIVPTSSTSSEVDSPEDCDFSDAVLKFISQMLMEEDMEEKSCMFQESSALQAAEKPFYEILGEKYPPSPNRHPLYVDLGQDSPVDNFNSNYASSSSSSNSNPTDTNWTLDVNEYKSSQLQTFPGDYTFQSTPQSSFNPSNDIGYALDGLVDSSANKFYVPDLYCESQPVWHFKKGVEEASKFLPNSNDLILDVERNGSLYQRKERNGPLHQEPKKESSVVLVKEEKKDEREHSPNGSRGKKNAHREDIDFEEGRSNKQSAVSTSTDDTVRSEMFDRVLLCTGKEGVGNDALREALQTEASKNVQQNGLPKASNGGKSRGKKQGGKRDMVDLRTLLIHCAQAVAADDRRSANELLKQIRQHSSPFGDGTQRLAHIFAEGLEARLAGTGSQIFTSLVNKKTSAADILKAYHLFLAACPFKKLANFFANQTIMNVSENATRLHIVDFGILYGFQWPCLIQRLSGRAGGPPSLRITGIDFPQPGFRPEERVEETGRRLANYAERFKVPFEYNAIAKKWETIQIEDLKIDPDEVVVVNCIFRLRNLLDETVVLDSPRNAVLSLIRKMNPTVFIHGIVNGSCSAPFFITRFREALFHYSALFDMLETNVPREHSERILIEREIFGREVMSVIACEGSERVERPETYKQWQIRCLRAGFQQLPLNHDIMKKAKDRVKSSYHKDFVIDEDSRWMLQGWKGRIIYAMSSWIAADD